MYLSTIQAFLSAACCTKRHRRFVQPGEEGAEGTGSPKCFLWVPKGEEFQGRWRQTLDRGAQQKIRGNYHNEQQRKILPKKNSDKTKNFSVGEWFSSKAGVQRHVGSSSLGDEAWLGKALRIQICLYLAEGWAR